jgi:DNA repair and recombination protein RAD54B
MNFDLVICDEGHRLKTQGNKSAKAIHSFQTTRRILLTGTPIQNDLGEFWTMVDFVNPGLLETYATFKKAFEMPIVKSRQPGAKKKDIELGKGRSEALSKLTGMFVLRRTSEILSQYLPMKCTFSPCH